MDEAHAVTEYIQKLLLLEEKGRKVTQADIGVIVPYKLQTKIIKRICDRLNLNEIVIGTPEAFQGQEKPIMIVTTVRSDGYLGFLNDPRVCLLLFVMFLLTLFFMILKLIFSFIFSESMSY